MPNEPSYEIAERTQEADTNNVDYSRTKESRFYANHVGTSATAFDIRLTMSDVDIDGKNNKLVANTTAVLILSPRLAVFLLQSLAQAIEGHQSKFGPIVMPQGSTVQAPPPNPATEEPQGSTTPETTISETLPRKGSRKITFEEDE